MSLVIGILAALLVIFLLGAVFVRNRRFGLVLSLISVALIVLAVFFYSSEDDRVQTLQARISPDEIVISNPQYQLSYGNFYQLTARIENKSSRYMLYSLVLGISVYLCPENQSDVSQCKLLKEVDHEVDTRIKSLTAEKINTYIALEQLPEDNSNLVWQVKVNKSIGR